MFHTLFGFGSGSQVGQEESRFNTEHLGSEGLLDYELFVDRDENLKKSVEVLRSDRRPLVIEGEEGVGKTCLLTAIKRSFMNLSMREGEILRVSEIDSEMMNPEDLVREVGREWGLSVERQDFDPVNLASEMCEKLESSESYLLLVEIPKEFSEVSEENRDKLLDIFSSLTEAEDESGEPKISLVLAGSPSILTLLGSDERVVEGLDAEKICLQGLNRGDFDNYLDKYLAYSELNPDFVVESGREEIFERSGGVPSRVNSVIEQLIQSISGQGPIPRINRDRVEEALG
ncbi:hypothetical protein AKJ64_03445 [candidate division MSBL1 archaeon SCGC-AAA259E17]|uniref:ORC1/DEAH AAA+ ATPase domain-containing protein n=1 Tax=candidate division MSBL1 archaeon SCGC-AAA259E17 TaxID=1698263 RepID=A0A133UDN1_9EURY|nr:hypothetical protein AKJ64_03445 [candidate division MSBL1 archaeon SCGC-AAA259E17]